MWIRDQDRDCDRYYKPVIWPCLAPITIHNKKKRELVDRSTLSVSTPLTNSTRIPKLDFPFMFPSMFVEHSFEPVFFFKFHFYLKWREWDVWTMDYGECKNTSSALIQIFVTLLLKDLDTRNFKGWKSENYSSLQKNDKKIMSLRQRASTKLVNKRSLCMLLAYNCILNIWLRVICSLHTHSQKIFWIVYSTWLIKWLKKKTGAANDSR